MCKGSRLGSEEIKPKAKIDFLGTDDQQRVELWDTYFEFQLPFTITERLSYPVLRIHHPTFPVQDYFPGTQDNRRVGMILYAAWIEPR